MKNIFYILCLVIIADNSFAQQKDYVAIRFENFINGKKLELNDKIYTNAFGENFSISKLKYYISNIRIVGDTTGHSQSIDHFSKKFFPNAKEEINRQLDQFKSNIFLIDASGQNNIYISKPSLNIIALTDLKLEFWVGVDSILNCSGAQEGALDPLNDMFWTWNNGYVNFKMEGESKNSRADKNRIEYHIGGYKTGQKTLQHIYLPLNLNLNFCSLEVRLDLDKYWNGVNQIKISSSPVIVAPGKQAVDVASNFKEMFSVEGTDWHIPL